MGLKRQEKELIAQWRTLIRDITLSQLNIWKIGGDLKTKQKEMKRYVFYNAITLKQVAPKGFWRLYFYLFFVFLSSFSLHFCMPGKESQIGAPKIFATNPVTEAACKVSSYIK